MAIPGSGRRCLRPGRRRRVRPDADGGRGAQPPARRTSAARGAACDRSGAGRLRAPADPAGQPYGHLHTGGRGTRKRRLPARVAGAAPSRPAAPAGRSRGARGDRGRIPRRRRTPRVRDATAIRVRGPAVGAGTRAGARSRRLGTPTPRDGAGASRARGRGIPLRPAAGRTRGGRCGSRPRGCEHRTADRPGGRRLLPRPERTGSPVGLRPAGGSGSSARRGRDARGPRAGPPGRLPGPGRE